MTRTLFAVIRTRGPRWNDAEPMEGQEDWRAHADFMNALVAQGLMPLGGPMLGTRDVPLIVRWSAKDLLRTLQISPWQLRLGSLGDP